MSIILGSASPRRHELLAQLGVEFTVASPDIDETPLAGERPTDYVRRLAVEKSRAVRSTADALVITADTTVDLGGEILGKPVDAADAAAMLRRLSARTHRVHTGVAVRRDTHVVTDVVTTLVTFTPLTPEAIDWYVGTGEPLDKAGAYAVQGAGGVFVLRVRGSVSNVVGLPLHAVSRLAADLGSPLVG
ncbi:MAG: septum formation inhibitor Maf [Actinobacteria bacterium]|nr:septum formation inhibitor Maf [Actinomycetota bacterium]